MKTLLSLAVSTAATLTHAQDTNPGVEVAAAASATVASGAAANFTGPVRITSPFQAPPPGRAGGAVVSFEPRARTAWHTHPLGQTLIVTAGVGLVQQLGQAAQVMRPGDVVTIPANVRHWHGAGPNGAMTHVAIAEKHEGQSVAWEEKVSDPDYQAALDGTGLSPTARTGTGTTADYRQNPFSLAYAGAITRNVEGAVNIRPVSYKLNGLDIVANLYTPAGFDPGRKYPAVVVAHPNGGVKEQVAGLYAQRLAEQGYIAIAADAAYQGGSGGMPRYVDKPMHRVEDIHGMADFIASVAGVDTARLGLLGICGGGGYALKAAQSDKRFKAVATLSMFNSGLVRRNGYMDSQRDTVQARLQQASQARAAEAAGGAVAYANTATLSDEQIAALPFELYRQGLAYYGKTHFHPDASGAYTLSSLLDLMRWDATDGMDLIAQPLLMMAGSRADSLYMSQAAYAKAVGTQDKELFLIDGATHIETYWKPEYVDQAAARLKAFFGRTL